MSNGGGRANRRGQSLERSIEDLLTEEYEKIPSKEFLARRKDKKPIFSRQFTHGKNIYAKARKVDFILYHPVRWPDCLVIQCKWQASPGSIDEKYPFEVLSIKMNPFKTIIVLDGGGYAKGAEKWLRDQVGKNNLIHVFNIGDISKFQSRGKL